jgi:hypothetical protein
MKILTASYPEETGFEKLKEELAHERVAVPTGFEAKLPWFSQKFCLSADLKDYFFRATPILISDLPNRNGVGFPVQSLVEWNEDLHCQAYEGWKYCPMFEEHRSDDPKTALGVVADVTLRKLKGYCFDKLWVVIALAAIDRTKNVSLAAKYESGQTNTVSMGAMVDGWKCSYCGAPEGRCEHIDPERDVTFYELNGRLVFKEVFGVAPYELSIVADPAYGVASGSDSVIKYA